MYTGSMFGKSALVYAVWGYVLANQRPDKRAGGLFFVELNPLLLGPMFATTPEAVLSALSTLCAPDPVSRTPDEDGRRLVPVHSIVCGPAVYRVVNGKKYAELRDEDDRREYLRLAKQKQRAAEKLVAKEVLTVNKVNRRQPPSSHVDVDLDVDSEERERAQASGDSRHALSRSVTFVTDTEERENPHARSTAAEPTPESFPLEHHVRCGFEKRYLAAKHGPPNQRQLGELVAALAPWVRAAATIRRVSERELLEAVLGGFFAHPKAAAAGYRPGFLATDPSEFLDPPATAPRGAAYQEFRE